jgi:hypothetical protein
MSAPSPSRAQRANHEALGWLGKLDALAATGDAEAIRMFHSITCGMVTRLNELHSEYAASVLEWPVLLPQDRDARSKVTMQANGMRIGSVRGAGKGAGKGSKDLLAYDSQKGFAIQNLRRVDFARAILHPLTPALEYEGAEEVQPAISSQIQATIDDPSDFAVVTQIANFGEQLLLDISNLPDYTAETRDDWIRVIVAVLRRNRHLVPKKFNDSQRKDEHYAIENRLGDEVEFTDTNWRGGILALTLRGGLETVYAVPGIWGE